MRSAPVAVLAALAALGAVSAAWTLAGVTDTLRWAALVCGYAGVAVAAGAFVRTDRDLRILASGLAVLAYVAGLAGIAGVGTLTEPFADRIDGTWRAGGTLEYPPALGLLQVSALPVLLTAMARRPGSLAAAAAASGAAVAGMSLALTGSRLYPFLAACLLGAAVLRPRATLRSDVRTGMAAAVLVAVSALAAVLLAPGNLIALLAPPLLAAVCWRAGARTDARFLLALLAGFAALVAVAAAGPAGDGLHGRADLWDAALSTAAERPLLGAGADAFFVASVEHQSGALARFAHDLPLELLVELGVAGLLLGLGLYAACVRALWRARASPAAWLLGPAVAAFLVGSLVDWPWHMAGSGAVFAAALGGVIAARDL